MKTTLKTLRKYAQNPQQIDLGYDDKNPIFYYFGELLPEQKAHEIIDMRYTGWFTDVDGYNLCWGIVVSLPPSPGFPDGRHLAGYHWGDNDERVLWPDLYETAEDAARYADGHAERFAEDQREDNARWHEARRIEDETEDALKRLRECLALRHRQCMRYIRDEITELCETIRDNRERLSNEFADYV